MKGNEVAGFVLSLAPPSLPIFFLPSLTPHLSPSFPHLPSFSFLPSLPGSVFSHTPSLPQPSASFLPFLHPPLLYFPLPSFCPFFFLYFLSVFPFFFLSSILLSFSKPSLLPPSFCPSLLLSVLPSIPPFLPSLYIFLLMCDESDNERSKIKRRVIFPFQLQSL